MLNHKIEAEALKKAIEHSEKILLVSHKNPDGDTIGSVCAWLDFLGRKGKTVVAFCQDPVPQYLAYLPGAEQFMNDPAIFDAQYDLIIVNDAGSIDYAGIDIFADKFKGTTLVNIDHHATNTQYGDINLVISNASSNTEVLARLFLYWGEEITKPMALALLNGIITDTDHLTNPATNYRSLDIAAHLVRSGADILTIATRVLKNKSITDLKLWGRVLARLKRNEQYNIITTYVTADDLRELGGSEESVGGISNYLSLIGNVNIVMFLRVREDGVIKASMRTVKDHVNVGTLAANYFGGGGHKKASGFQVQGTLIADGDGWTIV